MVVGDAVDAAGHVERSCMHEESLHADVEMMSSPIKLWTTLCVGTLPP